MNRRRYMGKKGVLPSGYTMVEYIENTSDAYIDTNYTLDLTETIYIKVSVSEYVVNYGAVFGNYADEQHNCTRIINNNQNTRNAILFYNNKAGGGGKQIPINGLNQINEYSLSPEHFIVNGTIYTQTNIRGEGFNSKIQIFRTSERANGAKGKLYYFQITNGRNMIPCINPNNVVGLYDTVEGRFYSSPNGTAFIAGPVID